jgi:hypothetical protein
MNSIMVHKGRLRMPRVYTLSIPVCCAYDGVTRWMDNGRMNWSKPPAWRVYLRRPAPKPPCTNRGVSHRILNAPQCQTCGELLIRHYITDGYGNPFCDFDCQDANDIPF